MALHKGFCNCGCVGCLLGSFVPLGPKAEFTWDVLAKVEADVA
jgi:hypothetical protein